MLPFSDCIPQYSLQFFGTKFVVISAQHLAKGIYYRRPYTGTELRKKICKGSVITASHKVAAQAQKSRKKYLGAFLSINDYVSLHPVSAHQAELEELLQKLLLIGRF